MINWTAIAADALSHEGAAAYGGRTVAELADALERGYEAGTVIYAATDDYIDFRVLALPK